MTENDHPVETATPEPVGSETIASFPNDVIRIRLKRTAPSQLNSKEERPSDQNTEQMPEIPRE